MYLDFPDSLKMVNTGQEKFDYVMFALKIEASANLDGHFVFINAYMY